MQYIKHDFIKNWENAIKYNDYYLVNDILSDEIAKLIVFDKSSVIKAMADSGINVKAKISEKELVKRVVFNIDRNETFRKSIVGMILKHNISDKEELVKANNNFTGNGRYKPDNYEQQKLEKHISKWVSGLNANLYLNFDSKDTSDSEKIVTNKVEQHMDNKNLVDKIATRPIDVKKLAYIYLGLAAVGVLSLWYFNKKFAKKYALGGEIEGDDLNPSPEITQPIDVNNMGQSPELTGQPPITPQPTTWTPPIQNPAQPVQ